MSRAQPFVGAVTALMILTVRTAHIRASSVRTRGGRPSLCQAEDQFVECRPMLPNPHALVLWVEKWLRGVQTVPELEAAIARDAALPQGYVNSLSRTELTICWVREPDTLDNRISCDNRGLPWALRATARLVGQLGVYAPSWC